MIFVKKISFFIMRKVMLILRFPHSFGVWGCWGRSNSIHFAIFRVSGTPKSMISTKSCPGSRILSDPGWEQNIFQYSCAPVPEPATARIILKSLQNVAMMYLCCRYIFGFLIFSSRKIYFCDFLRISSRR